MHGLQGDEEDLATQTVAMIASDMVQAGQGRDVLAIWAQAAPKGDEGEGDGKKSPLLRALERMPGLGNGPGSSQLPMLTGENRSESAENTQRPTDPASVTLHEQPFFSPQRTLIPPSLDTANPLPTSAERARDAGARGTEEEWGAGTPYPPSAASPGTIHLDTENFEKNLGDRA